jgi:hypothetical protein
MEITIEQFELLREQQKQKENDLSELKAAVEFLKGKVVASIIANEPSSEVLSNGKEIPKKIKFSAVAGTATGKIATQ